MNSAIRRLSIVVLVMFLALMGFSTSVQFFDAKSLNADPRIEGYVVESENFESIHNHSAYALIERDKTRAK